MPFVNVRKQLKLESLRFMEGIMEGGTGAPCQPSIVSIVTLSASVGKEQREEEDREIGCLLLGWFESHDSRELTGTRREGDRTPC